MAGTQRKNFTGNLKDKVALEAIRSIKTVNEIGQEFGIYPTQVGLWEKELQQQASHLFNAKSDPRLSTHLSVRSGFILKSGN